MKRKKRTINLKTIGLFLILAVQLLNSAVIFAQSTQVKPFGVMDDSYDVSSTGSYNHIIPIHVAPGINGIEPSIALTYDSKSGISELGHGWSITGLSKISRGGNNIAQHGKTDCISFSEKDALLLDGMLLTCIKGNNTSGNSEYRTENENHSRIIASNENAAQNSSSAKYFIVKQSNGLTYYYGTTSDSRLLLSLTGDQKEVMEWSVSKIEDVYGNYIKFTYVIIGNVSRIETIEYTGNDNQNISPSSKINFRYYASNEVIRRLNISLFHGEKFQNSNVLKSIEIETDRKAFKHYLIQYNKNQEKVVAIRECSMNDTSYCIPKTVFAYNTPKKLLYKEINVTKTENPKHDRGSYLDKDEDYLIEEVQLNVPINIEIEVPSVPKPQNIKQYFIDFNHDGYQDLVLVSSRRTAKKKFEVYADFYKNKKEKYDFESSILLSKGDGIKKYTDINLDKIQFLHLNKDELIDIVANDNSFINESTVNKIEFKKNEGFCSTCSSHLAMKNESDESWQKIVSADLNGDRLDEIIVFEFNSDEKKNKVIVLGNEKDGWKVETYKKPFYKFEIADLNGSGLQTIVLFEKNNFEIILRNGDKYETKTIAYPSGVKDDLKGLSFLDVNQDGISDLYKDIEGDNIKFWLYNGYQFGDRFELSQKINVADKQRYIYGNFTSKSNLQFLVAFKNDSIVVKDIVIDGKGVHFSDAIVQLSVPSEFKVFETLEALSNPIGYLFPDNKYTKKSRKIPYMSYPSITTSDLDKDGTTELVLNSREKRKEFKHQYFTGNLITSVKDGFNNVINIKYSGLADTAVYTVSHRKLGSDYSYYHGSFPVVKEIEYSNGLENDSVNRNRYYYEDLITETNGRGLSGFRSFTKMDGTNGIRTSTEYLYRFPLTGKISREKKIANDSVTFFDQQNSWSFLAYEINEIGSSIISTDELLNKHTRFSLQKRNYIPILQSTKVFRKELNNKKAGFSEMLHYYDNLGFIKKTETILSDSSVVVSEKDILHLDYNNQSPVHVFGLISEERTFVVKNHKDTSSKRIFSYEFDTKTASLLKKIRQKGSPLLEQTIEYEYDGLGNKISKLAYRLSHSAIKEKYTYDSSGRYVRSYENAVGHKHVFEYNKHYGVIALETDPNDLTKRYEYDEFGNLKKIMYQDGNSIDYKFEFLSDAVDIFSRINSRAMYKLITSQAGLFSITQYYDKLGREVSSVRNGIDLNEYKEKVNITNKRNGIEGVDFFYKSIYRKIITRKKYDAKGNIYLSYKPQFIQLISDALKAESCVLFEDSVALAFEAKYDALSRVIKVTHPDGNNLKTIYDANSKSEFDYAENKKTYRFNEKSELETVVDAKGSTIHYTYDSWGNLSEIKSEEAFSRIEYDELGRKKKLVDQNLGVIDYEYDEFDRLVKETTNAQKVIKMQYDKLGRLVLKITPEGKTKWFYDGNKKGKLDSVVDVRGNTKVYTYDGLCRLISVSHVINNKKHTTTFGYDSYSRINRKTFPSGYTITFRYAENYLVGVNEKKTNGKEVPIATIKELNANNQVVNKMSGNGIRSKYIYNSTNNLLLTIQTFKDANYKFEPKLLRCLPNINFEDLFERQYERPRFPNPGAYVVTDFEVLKKSAKSRVLPGVTATSTANIQNEVFSYDKSYNITGKYDAINNISETYSYDNLHRLQYYKAASQKDTIQDTIKYSEGGNILYKSKIGFYKYDTEAKQRLIETTGITKKALTYDDFGNVVSEDEKGIRLYYTSFNKPDTILLEGKNRRFITHGSDQEEIFTEDWTFRERRFLPSIWELNKTRTIPFNDYEIVSDKVTGRKDTIHYISLGNELVAIQTHSGSRGKSIVYLHNDHQGSVKAITDKNGVVIDQYRYSPFGQRTSSLLLTNNGFTGHDHLDDFGLINMKGRYYVPETGRFMSPDPIIQAPDNLQSLNRYSYVVNNPLNLIDPSGFNWFEDRIRDVGNAIGGGARAVSNIGREIGRAGQGFIDLHKNIYKEGDRFVNKYGKQLVIVAAAVAITYFSGGSMSGLGIAMLKGAAWGSGISAGITAYHGGSFKDILNAGYNGAINGAVSGAAAFSIGSAFANTDQSLGSSGYLGKTLAHGVSGGIQSEAAGGEFRNGFLSASISNAFTPMNESLFGTHPDNAFKRVAFASAIGGVSSHFSGGNVAEGATIAGFVQGFNHEVTYAKLLPQAGGLLGLKNLYDGVQYLETGDHISGAGVGLSMGGAMIRQIPHPAAQVIGWGVTGAGQVLIHRQEIIYVIENYSPPRSYEWVRPGPKW